MNSPAAPSPSNHPEDPAPAAGQLSDEWLTPFKFGFLLVLLLAAFFPEVLFGGKSFMIRDFGLYTYPNAFFQRECFWQGTLPLWNPLNNCGVPFLAQWNTDCLYPLSLIYLLLPLTLGLTLFLLFHLFWAGLGMFLLATHWTQNRLAAAVAGVAFAFNGMTLNCLMWSSNLSALAWMPWVILLVERAWLAGGSRRLALASLASAAQILTGAPEIIFFTWLVLFALWVGRLVGHREDRARIFFRATIMGATAVLLSAAQLLPFLQLLAHSERSVSYGASIWAIPTWGWVNLLVPLFHCYRAALGVYFQPTQDWTSSYYLGIGALALALAAVASVRVPRVWLLAGLGVFGFGVALGDRAHLYPLLLKLFPPLGFMRYPIKFVFLTVFATPLLAAFAVAQYRQGHTGPAARTWKWIGSVAAAFVFVVAGVIWHAHAHPFPSENWPVLCENGCLRVVNLLLMAGVLWWYGAAQTGQSRMVLGLLLLSLLWLDVVTHAPRQNPTVEAPAFQPGLLVQRINPPPKLGEMRALLTRQSHQLFYSRMLTDTYADLVGRRCALMGDANLLDGIPVGDGFYSLYIREQRSLFMEFFLSPTNAFPAGFADFLAIAQASSPEKILDWQWRPSHLPFYSLGARPEFVEPSNTPALLLSRDFDPRRVVYLPPEARDRLTATNAARGVVQAAHFSPQEIELEVEANGPALLVLSQTYYDPWQAYVNGQPQKIWRANYAFQAVAVPPGKSIVKLVYRDQWFHWGLLVTGLALAGCLAAGLRRNHRAATG